MSKEERLRLIKRRYRISQRASRIEARSGRNRIVDYHAGAMGALLCLGDDIVKYRASRRRSA